MGRINNNNMNDQDSKLVREYMEGKAMLKKLTEDLKDVEPKVLALVEDVGLPVEGELGKLSVSLRSVYVYPPEIIGKEAELKAAKEIAKQNTGQPGGCSATEVPMLRFTAKKKKKIV